MAEKPLSVLQALGSMARKLEPALRLQKRRLLLGTLFVVASIGTALAYPQVIRITIDEGIQTGDGGRIQFMALIMVGLLMVQAPATYLHVYLFQAAGRRVAAWIQERLHGNLLRQEIGFFDAESAGELNSRLNADAQLVLTLVDRWVPDALRFGLFAFCGIGLMVYTSPLLSVVVLAVVPVMGFTTTVLGRVIQRRQAKEQFQTAGVAATSLESLAAVRTVRAYDQEPAEGERFRQRLRALITVGDRRTRYSATLEAVTTLSSEIGVVIGISAGGMAIVSGKLTAGALVSFIFYAGLVVRGFKNLSRFGAEVMRIHGATERIFELMARESALPSGANLTPATARGDIQLSGVHFAYPTRPDVPILRGLDLTIPAGEFLAVVGPSGMGKSTIGNLIVRLYDPDAGTVTFDGADIRELDPTWLRKQVTLVSQDSSLFARSIDENTRFGSEDASEEDVERVLEATNAREFIDRQPQGRETVVGDRGVAFSGGQRQRLAIARALLREPKVLILDEATSALDSESESFVKDSLRKLAHHPTIILVAHRLSSVVDADRVIVVQDGRVAASGTHASLMQDSPVYRELVFSQLVSD